IPRRSASSPRRAASSRFSSRWVVRCSASKPKVPAPPLIECAARKIAFNCSGSGCARSSANKCASMPSSSSPASSKNESWNSETSTSLPPLELQGGHRQGCPVRGGQWIVIVGRYGIGLSVVLRQRRAVGDALRGLGRQHQELDAAIG